MSARKKRRLTLDDYEEMSNWLEGRQQRELELLRSRLSIYDMATLNEHFEGERQAIEYELMSGLYREIGNVHGVHIEDVIDFKESEEIKELVRIADQVLLSQTFTQVIQPLVDHSDHLSVLQATQNLRRLFSFLDVLRSPFQRCLEANRVMQIFMEVKNHETTLLPSLVWVVEKSQSIQVRCIALRVLSCIAAGPLLGTLPTVHPFHPSSMYFKKVLSGLNILTLVKELIQTAEPDLVVECLNFVEQFSNINPLSRDHVILEGFFSDITQAVKRFSDNIEILQGAMSALAILFKSSGRIIQEKGDYGLYEAATIVVTIFLSTSDEKCVLNFLSIIEKTPELLTTEEEAIYAKILKHILGDKGSSVVSKSIATLRKLMEVKGDETTKKVVDFFLENAIQLLRGSDSRVAVETMRCMIEIVKNPLSTRKLLNLKGFREVMSEHTFKKTSFKIETLQMAITLIFNILNTTHENFVAFLELDGNRDIPVFLSRLLPLFSSHKESESGRVVSLTNKTYRINLIRICLNTLILVVENEVENTTGLQVIKVSRFGELITAEVIDQLLSLALVIRNDLAEDISMYRFELLWKIKHILLLVGRDPSHKHKEKIKTILREWFDHVREEDGSGFGSGGGEMMQADFNSGATVTIKVKGPHSTRNIATPQNCTLTHFRRLLFKYFRKSLEIQYVDGEDFVTISSNEEFRHLMWSAKRNFSEFSQVVLYARETMDFSVDFEEKKGQGGIYQEEDMANFVERNIKSHSVKFNREELMALYKQWIVTMRNGYVSRENLYLALQMKGMKLRNETSLSLLYEAFDENGDGRVDIDEIARAFSVIEKGTKREKLRMAFRAIDKDKSGFIDRLELFNVLKSITWSENTGEEMDDEILEAKVVEIFQDVDKDGDGNITFSEFVEGLDKYRFIDIFHFVNPSSGAET